MTYKEAINEAPVVLVEFFATWCPHCQRMMPIMDKLKTILGSATPIIQIDIDQNPQTTAEEHVEGTPTFIIYKNGQEVWRHSGEIAEDALLAKVKSF